LEEKKRSDLYVHVCVNEKSSYYKYIASVFQEKKMKDLVVLEITLVMIKIVEQFFLSKRLNKLT
jgi:hypothetical protein